MILPVYSDTELNLSSAQETSKYTFWWECLRALLVSVLECLWQKKYLDVSVCCTVACNFKSDLLFTFDTDTDTSEKKHLRNCISFPAENSRLTQTPACFSERTCQGYHSGAGQDPCRCRGGRVQRIA